MLPMTTSKAMMWWLQRCHCPFSVLTLHCEQPAEEARCPWYLLRRRRSHEGEGGGTHGGGEGAEGDVLVAGGEAQDLEGLGDDHALLGVVGGGDALEALEAVQGSLATLGPLRHHSGRGGAERGAERIIQALPDWQEGSKKPKR